MPGSNNSIINAYKDVRRMTIGAAFLGAVLVATSVNNKTPTASTDKITDDYKSCHAYLSEESGQPDEIKQNHTNPQAGIANVFIGAALCIGGLAAAGATSKKIRELKDQSNYNANKPPPSL